MLGYKDILTVVITLMVVSLFWLVSLLFVGNGSKGRITRNFLHFTAGLWGILWLHFESRLVATGLALLGVLTIALMIHFKDFPLFGNLSLPFSFSQEGKWGVAFYSFSLLLITFFLWEEKGIGSSLIFSLALGDGLADAIGSRWGKIKLPFPWNKNKTMEGSLACFFGSTLGIYLGEIIAGEVIALPLVFLGGLICSLVEAVSPPELDNLLMPVSLGAFLLLVP